MRVAILHFHLRPGGVTRVIELAVESLSTQPVDVLVIGGEPVPESCRIAAAGTACVPELAYGVSPQSADALYDAVDAACIRHWGEKADVIHIHNHALGKNFALPIVVARWAGEGRALVIQLHDFAENGRPANYRLLKQHLGGITGLSRTLYPVSQTVRYAVLNSRDRASLEAAGLSNGANILPNPVAIPPGGSAIERELFDAERLIVYPTRAIRRKNLGEAVLWAALAAEGDKIVLTAGAQSDADRMRHDQWRSLAETLDLPVVFDAQSRFSRPAYDFLLGADVCLTTSVMEGFGMAFLEPFLAGKPLCGRDLPFVTTDFHAAGLRYEGFYKRLEIPARLVDRKALAGSIRERVSAACGDYEISFSEDFITQATASVGDGDSIDFGRLDEAMQSVVIEKIAADPSLVGKCVPNALTPDFDSVRENQRVVIEQYAVPNYGEKLLTLYRESSAQPGGGTEFLDASRVLSAFVRFDDFFALCG
jgi:glycosyltransferase involved in cell wall biosynthesis